MSGMTTEGALGAGEGRGHRTLPRTYPVWDQLMHDRNTRSVQLLVITRFKDFYTANRIRF